MNSVVLLVHPSFWRICREGALNLALKELEICCQRSEIEGEISLINLGGVDYLQMNSIKAFSKDQLESLSKLSFLMAFFEKKGELLFPLNKIRSGEMEEKLSSILKYSGKTNELFTRLMIHIALLSCECVLPKRPLLFDPLCGKGTTLFEGLIAGFNVYGVEIGKKAVGEAAIYFKKYLETEKYRHFLKKEHRDGKNALVYTFEFAKDKKELLENPFKLCFMAGDSKKADKYFKQNSFHLLVADLPYGVAHGNVTKEGKNSLTRNPSELLKACLPSWAKLLKKGGSLVLSWNSFLLSAKDMGEIILENGFSLKFEPKIFEHRVDQAIRRDIMVAIKK